MSEYKKVKIGDFLTESKEESFDSDASKRITVRLNCKGIEQRSLKAEKEGATKYFVRHSGQFIYGKQNFHKGAFGIIPEKLDGFTSSADLPAFDFTNTSCFPEYLNLWFQVDEQYKRLQKNVKGVGSQRLAVSIFLNQEILLPDLETQKEIVKKVSINLKNVETLTKEIESQKAYAKQLRQNILQDAIEGKLTAEWRKTHPVIKGNPDFDAEALFEEIQKEKKYCKPEKLQEPLFFEALNLPNTWEYPTLFEITKQITDGTHLTPNYVSNGEIFLSAQNVKPFKFIPEVHKYVSKEDFESYRNNRTPELNDILMARVGAGIGEAAVIDQPLEFAFYVSLCLIKTFKDLVIPEYITCVLNSAYGTNYSKNNISSTGASAGNYNLGHIRSLKIPLPPIKEQEEILNILSRFLNKVEELEQEIKQREEYANQLVQRILKDAFEER